MSGNEAIKIMITEKECTLRCEYGCGRKCWECECGLNDDEAISAYDAAIEALTEIQQYRSIGTPDECRAAVEKQGAKKLELDCGTRKWADCDGNFSSRHENCYICPSCEVFLGYVSDCKDEQCQGDYCRHCGQRISWETDE